jgi:hypothetical protein
MMGNYRGFKMALVTGACVVLLQFGAARGSQEGQLAWSSFSVESPGIGSSGPVTNTVSRADRAKQCRIKLALVRIQDGFRIVGQVS